MTHYVECPHCGDPMEVEEYPSCYAIIANGKAVGACPVCGTKLEYRDGKLVERHEHHELTSVITKG